MEVSKTQGSAPLALPLTTIEVKKNMDHLKKILLKKNDIFVEIKRQKKKKKLVEIFLKNRQYFTIKIYIYIYISQAQCANLQLVTCNIQCVLY